MAAATDLESEPSIDCTAVILILAAAVEGHGAVGTQSCIGQNLNISRIDSFANLLSAQCPRKKSFVIWKS